MEFQLFHEIFNDMVIPLISEVKENNSQIEAKNLLFSEKMLFEKYNKLRTEYKELIFGKDSEELLDRHKIASSICGSFLEVPVFDKTAIIKQLIATKKPIEAYFYYSNEYVAFMAGCKYLVYYMSSKRTRDEKTIIINNFPIIPPSIKNISFDTLNSILFNLSLVNGNNKKDSIYFDKYSYAMLYFMLENYFYLATGISARK